MIRIIHSMYSQKDTAREAFESLFDGFHVLGQWDRCDGIRSWDVVLFDGGTDVDPRFYGEERGAFTDSPDLRRDEFEKRVFRAAQAAGAACLGICRGAQFLNVLSGGSLIQHVTGHKFSNHLIYTKDGRAMPAKSDHHQMMLPTNRVHHELIAWAEEESKSYCDYAKEIPEFQPEILFIPDTRSLCIQPHPEWMSRDSEFATYCRDLVIQYLFKSK